MYVSLPQGGHYVNFVYCDFMKSQTTSNLHTNIIYIYIINARNPTKPNENTFSQLFRNETNPSPK